MTGSAGWFTPGQFCVCLGLLIVLTFPDVLFGQHTFYYRDFGIFGYPLARYHRECFWHGEVPFWNPYSNCGLPFLAQWNTMVFYPLTLIYLLLPLEWSLGLFVLSHLFLMGLGMYALARRWTGSMEGAALAGLTYSFNGFVLNCLMWPNCLPALAWMPLVVLITEQAWHVGGRRLILAALAGAMQMLTGMPEIIAFTWLCVICLWLTEWRCNRTRTFVGLWRLGVPALLGTALAAVALLPFLELVTNSQRGANYADAGWAMPRTGWANFLVPLFHTYRSFHGVFVQYGQKMVSSYYLGLGAVLLALWAVARVRERRVWLLAVLAVVGMTLALGDDGWLYSALRKICPAVGLARFQVKFVILTVFAIPLLAAFAVRPCAMPPGESMNKVRRSLVICACVLAFMVLVLLWFACRYPMPRDDWPMTLRNGIGRLCFLSLATLASIGWLTANAVKLRAGCCTLFLLAIWADVLTHTPELVPRIERWVYQPGLACSEVQWSPLPSVGESRALVSPEALQRLRHHALENREQDYVSRRLGLYANCNLLDHIPKVNGFFPLYPREIDDIMGLIYDSGRTNLDGLLNFLGVSHVNPPGEMLTWRSRTNWLPMATIGAQPLFLDSQSTLEMLASPEFDARAAVCLSHSVGGSVTATNRAIASILSANYAPHRIDLEVEAAAPAMLVLAQTYYPAWRAEVENVRVPLWRANHAFQALQVPAGRHHVRLRYSDRWFQGGAIISLVSLLGCGIAWLRFNKKPVPTGGAAVQRSDGICPETTAPSIR